MQSDWQDCTLGDAITLKRGYDLPAKQRRPGQVPIVSSSGLSDHHAEAMVKGPGVVTGRYGTIGQVFYVDCDFWPLNTTLYVQDFKGNDQRFVAYMLRTLDFHQFSDKAAVPGVNRNHLHTARIALPQFAEQVRIAELLQSFDDRIDLFRQTNSTLESIAQALFKSWFVDFNPVRAKSEGREPEGVDAATAALFPAEFEESALGLIPRGWMHSTLGAVCAAAQGAIQTGPFGSQLHASDYVEEGIPVVMPQDMQGRRVSEARIARIPKADADRLSRHKLAVGDIVFSRRGDVGRHATVSEREVGWLCGTGCLLVRPGTGAKSSAYLSQALAHTNSIEWLQRHAVGATMPNLNTGILESLPLLSPSDAVLEAFERIAGPLESRITLNHANAGSLSSVRDELLPRLISGRLRLPEAPKQMEDGLA
jgi:type I restriction enzyme, S subunit